MERSTSTLSIQQVLLDAVASDFGRLEGRQMPERRPSIVVNEDGCIVQRGFLIPNRTSASHPRTPRPSTSTYQPIMGFARPTGALIDAPELRMLAKKHPESLHRPTKSAGDLANVVDRNSKPSIGERRRTWQSGAKSSRWTEDELARAMCKPSSALHARSPPPGLATGRQDRTMHMHRTPNVQGDLKALGDDQPRKDSTARQSSAHADKHKGCKQDIKLVSQADSEDAIASDSEDDDDVFTDAELKQRLATQRQRISYAQRRSIQDERASAEFDRRVAEYDARAEQQAPLRIRLATDDQHESAIESDSEDEQVTSALRTATIHRYQNQIATSQGGPESQTARADMRSPSKRFDNRASVSVKITSEPVATLNVADTKAKDGVTPREIRSFEVDAPQRCRNLRPSKSRPTPAKGVLKKSDSPSSSSSSSSESQTKHVKTVKRQSFASKWLLTPSFAALTQIQNYWQTPRTQQQSQQNNLTGQADGSIPTQRRGWIRN